MTSLYNLVGEYKALSEKLSADGLDEKTIADTIESTGLNDDIATKAQGYVMVARDKVSMLPAIRAEIARLKELEAQCLKHEAALLDALKSGMEQVGVEEISCPLFKISIAKNPPAVDVYEPALLPAEYWTTPKQPEPQPNKVEIAKALKSGAEIQGARLTQTTRLKVS